jgi:hypothetical protein
MVTARGCHGSASELEVQLEAHASHGPSPTFRRWHWPGGGASAVVPGRGGVPSPGQVRVTALRVRLARAGPGHGQNNRDFNASCQTCD